MSARLEAGSTRELRAAPQVQRLNPVDLAMRCVDKALRRVLYPGVETQMLVWLDGRADVSRLRTAIARLSERYPVIASRLVEPSEEDGGRAYWRLRPGAVCPLQGTALHDDERQTVLDHAGQLLSTPHDPTAADPLRFHLLHRPGGKDVLLLQYNHVLMDNKPSVMLLRELARLSVSPGRAAPYVEPGNLILEYLRQFPHATRRAATLETIRLQAVALRGRAATLAPAGPQPVGPARLRIDTRILDSRSAAAIRARVVALCGFPAMSMAMLGSAFRAIDRCGPAADRRQKFVAGIGMGLERRDHLPLVLQNLTSVVPISAQRDDLRDWDRLVSMLSEQMRARLASGIDLGALRTTALFSRRPRYIEWVAEHLLHFGYSLWYAYFGSLDVVGAELCGAPIEQVFYTGPVWASTGLTLLVNEYRGRLHFQTTSDPRVVPPPLADAFLDFVLADLS